MAAPFQKSSLELRGVFLEKSVTFLSKIMEIAQHPLGYVSFPNTKNVHTSDMYF
jgi:hypothetical protein